MDIEKIEKILSGIVAILEEEEENVSAAAVLPVMQCHLLLSIYQKLDSIEAILSSIDGSMAEDAWNNEHNKLSR